MKVLNISLDKKIFEKDSVVRRRQADLASFSEEFHVLALKNGRDEKILPNFWIYGLKNKNKISRFFEALKKAGKIIKERKIDLVITQDPFFTGMLGWLLKRKFKIFWQAQIHTDFLSSYFWRESFLNKIRVILAKFLLPRADGLRVVSKRIVKSLKKAEIKLKSEPAILPIFVDVQKIKETSAKENLRQKYPQFDFLILMASRLAREKNIGLAIESLAEIIKEYPRTGLIIVGSGAEEKNLKEKIEKLKLEKNVILEPWREDLISYFKTADLFLLTSNYEGYAMAVVEAMAADLPVLMTEVGCAGEIVEDGKNGLVTPVGDKESLVLAIFKILDSKDLSRELVLGAKETILEWGNYENYLEKYKNLFEDCLK